jgi:hypothetical protein
LRLCPGHLFVRAGIDVRGHVVIFFSAIDVLRKGSLLLFASMLPVVIRN